MTTQTFDRSTHTMSPLEVEMLLWYYSRVTDYRDGDFSAPAVRGALEDFKGMGLIATRAQPTLDEPKRTPRTYDLTDGGKLLVNRICSTPFPELKWSY